MEEKQKRLVQSIANHVPKQNNGPRTPQERPVVLPGGRKWRNAKDAYNEEFIAEIISSQAELIMGSTLGYKFHHTILTHSQLPFISNVIIHLHYIVGNMKVLYWDTTIGTFKRFINIFLFHLSYS